MFDRLENIKEDAFLTSKESKLKDRFSYLDALISAIVEHEENLNNMISRLEKIVEGISDMVEKVQKNRGQKDKREHPSG